MSFYSSLVLAANTGVRNISPASERSLCRKVELLRSDGNDLEIGNLAEDEVILFNDAHALHENSHFFCPDTISFHESVEIDAYDGEYSGFGWSITIHGNGYFFPWDAATIRERVIRNIKLQNFKHFVEAEFGGFFTFPDSDLIFLRERWVDGTDGWIWFISESM